MPPKRSLTGLVVFFAAGAALAGETVIGTIIDNNSGSPVLSADVRVRDDATHKVYADLDTDSAGTFRSPDLPAGSYTFEISKPGFIGSNAGIEVAAAGSSVRRIAFPLVRMGVFTGRVTDQEGRPVAAADVFVLPADAGELRVRPYFYNRNTHVNAKGDFRLPNIPPGSWVIAATWGASTMAVGSYGQASASGLVGSGVLVYPDNAAPRIFTVTDGEQNRVDFTLVASSLNSVSGKVDVPHDQSGTLTSPRMWLALALITQPALASAVTQALPDGTFRLAGIAPGQYSLFASGPSNARSGMGARLPDDPLYGRTTVTVSGNDVEGVTMPLDHGKTVRVTLRRTGGDGCASASGAVLEPVEDWAASLERVIQLKVDRTETVEHLGPSRYRLRVLNPGVHCYQVATPVLDLTASVPPDPVTVTIAAAESIHGHVSGLLEPAGAEIILVRPGAAGASQTSQAVMLDSKFEFTFSGVPPGRYRITVRSNGSPMVKSDFEIEVRAGSPASVELRMPLSEP